MIPRSYRQAFRCNHEDLVTIVNSQDGVPGLLDCNKDEVVRYTCDAWGKVRSTTGSLASTLGMIQPFRYRGYVYDVETGLYYLRSRYYNPNWQRFVNEDAIANANLFYYCCNNPIFFLDTTGMDPTICGATVAKFCDVYERPNGVNYPYRLQPGTGCMITEWNGNYAKISYYHDNDFRTGYVLKDSLDTTESYDHRMKDDIFIMFKNKNDCYHEGSTGSEVLLLNICLNRYFDAKYPVAEGQLPYLRIPVEPEYSDKTKQYIEEFQRDCGLTVDGFAGNETLRKLQEWIKHDNGKG